MSKPIRIFKKDMLALRARGLTNAAIGRQLGCSKEYVRQVIGNSREINKERQDRFEQVICALFQQDEMAAGDIAKRVGLARGTVSVILHKHGCYRINNRILYHEGKRRCVQCRQIKSISEFGVLRNGPNGLMKRCRECNRQIVHEHYVRRSKHGLRPDRGRKRATPERTNVAGR